MSANACGGPGSPGNSLHTSLDCGNNTTHAVAKMPAGEHELVAGIDEMRIPDLRIVLPDLRPQPRLLQEARGDVPQRVALPDDVAVRMLVRPLDGGGINREG